jgi:hypothetical protein
LTPAALYVFISNPTLLHALREFLRRAECIAEQRRAHELEVYLPQTSSETKARRELDVYLATWQAMNPGIEAYVVDRGNGRSAEPVARVTGRLREGRPASSGVKRLQ